MGFPSKHCLAIFMVQSNNNGYQGTAKENDAEVGGQYYQVDRVYYFGNGAYYTVCHFFCFALPGVGKF
jgi:hypothetical protein